MGFPILVKFDLYIESGPWTNNEFADTKMWIIGPQWVKIKISQIIRNVLMGENHGYNQMVGCLFFNILSSQHGVNKLENDDDF